MLKPTEHVVVTLRRFASIRDQRPPCNRQIARYPGSEVHTYEGFHDIEVEIAREVGTIKDDLEGDHTGRTIALDDPRWPSNCICGYIFAVDDMKQEGRTRLYRRGDNGELVTVDAAPVGALYNARFHGTPEYNRNGAGVCLVCKTPAGEWLMDGPASNGPGWTRTGTPPDIVVRPSIGIGSPMRMHGWLGGNGGNEPGWLVIDIP